eukprot:GHVR01129270.1.p1 GENE.GHVR01129270.1~~GHVR01129270.1.p1  ORF type:complete len:116 (+),score=14.64 GHVR01129270.1:321-668(+)
MEGPDAVIDLFLRAFGLAKQNGAWTKYDIMEILFWMKLLLGIVIGIVFGLIGVTGVVYIGIFLYLVSLITSKYIERFEVDDHIEKLDILKEGINTSFPAFILSWTILYTFLHAEI